MLINIVNSFRVLVAVGQATFKEWAAYRTHSMVSLFVGPVYLIVQYFIWSAVFTGKELVNGFTFTEMLTYYGVAIIINYGIMDFADWNLQMLIQTGKFITFTLRPLSHRYFALSQKVGHRVLGLTLEFIPVYLLFYLIFSIWLIPANIFWALLSIALGFFMMFLVDYCIGMTGFWLVRTSGVRSMFLLFRDVFTGVLIPLTFFPDVLQKMLLFLPFQYISYVPVMVFLGSYELGGVKLPIPQIVALQGVAVLLMWGITEVIWRAGIKKFTGVGV